MLPLTSSHLASSPSYTSITSRSTSNLSNTLIQPTTMSTNSQQQHHHHHKSSRSQAQSALLNKLSSILPPSSSNLQIQLIEPILYFRGDTEESVGCFLRGNLILNLSKPTKIRKIEMKFVGRMKTFWTEGKLYYGSSNRNDMCEEQEILTHNWTFVSPPTSGTSLSSGSSLRQFKMLRTSSPSSTLTPAGVHKYPFELFIPGNVPETIKSKRGTVKYKLSAVAVRSGLSSNMHVSQDVTIIRTVLEERNSEGIVIANEWNDQLGYEITIPKQAYPMGNSIDVDLRLSPKDIKVVGIKIQINEKSVYKAKNQNNTESRILSVHNVEMPDENNSNTFQEANTSLAHEDENDLGNLYLYHKNISLPIPKCTSPINHSYQSSSINISHHLEFSFKVTNSGNDEGKKKKKKATEIKLNVPITILSCRCADDLPHYEDDYHRHNDEVDDSPSYESPPSYEQSTNNGSSQIRHNITATITTITDLSTV